MKFVLRDRWSHFNQDLLDHVHLNMMEHDDKKFDKEMQL